jgi:hypothetical protein
MRQVFVHFLEPLSYLVYVIAFLVIIRKRRDRLKMFLLGYYVVATALILTASMLSYKKTWGDNNWLYNIFFLLTIVTLSLYFHQLLTTPFKKLFVKGALVVNLLLFLIFDIALGQFFFHYNNYVIAVCYLSIVGYTFLYFHQVITNVTDLAIVHHFNFWLVTGYLVYFLGAFFIVLFYNNVGRELRGFVWGLQNIILLLSALLTLYGAIYLTKKQRS